MTIISPARRTPAATRIEDFPHRQRPPASDDFDRYRVAGVDLSVLRFDEAIEYLLDAPAAGRRLRVHFCAVHTLVEASKDLELRDALNEADLLAPDGMPLVWTGRLKGKRVERVCGPDAMLALLDRGRERGHRHFFYGSTPEVLDDLIVRLTERLPGVEVAGSYSPPFRALSWQEVESVVKTINESRADYVWVGLGSPKQDEWLAAFRPLLRSAVLLAVGAAFDFHAGHLRRAPRWAQRLGVEWLFRLASEPRRLAWRYAVSGVQLARLLLHDCFGKREPAL